MCKNVVAALCVSVAMVAAVPAAASIVSFDVDATAGGGAPPVPTPFTPGVDSISFNADFENGDTEAFLALTMTGDGSFDMSAILGFGEFEKFELEFTGFPGGLPTTFTPDGSGVFGTIGVPSFNVESGDLVQIKITASPAVDGTASVNWFASSQVAPIPLPASLPLLLAGIGGFAALRARKKAA